MVNIQSVSRRKEKAAAWEDLPREFDLDEWQDKIDRLPAKVLEILDESKASNEARTHHWLAQASWWLWWTQKFGADEILAILAEYCWRGERTPGEFKRAIWSAFNLWVDWNNGEKTGDRDYAPGEEASHTDPVWTAHILRKYPGSVDALRESSPVKRLPDDPSYYLRHLYQPDDLLCVVRFSQYVARRAYTRDEWLAHSDLLTVSQFLVANPMKGPYGMTQERMGGEPQESARAKDNAGPIRYVVSEWDGLLRDEQASLILHLCNDLDVPLRMVVFSGSKSLHAWWEPEPDDLTNLQTYLVRLGADPAALRPQQLVRLPAGIRWTGEWHDWAVAQQKVLYFKEQKQ